MKMKEKNQEILDEKIPQQRKQKLKKRLQIFLYLVTVPYRRLPWCLRDKTLRIYTKKE